MGFLLQLALMGVFVWAVGPWGIAIGVSIALLLSMAKK